MTTIPTLQSLYNGIISDLEAEFGVVISFFGKSFLRVIAAVQAAKLYTYCYLQHAGLQKNIWLDTAEPEAMGGTLERFCRIFLGRPPFPATQGKYNITITGNVNAVVDAGTIYKSNDDAANPGRLYILDTAYTLVSTTDTINVRALTAGIEGKLNVGEGLTATGPLQLVNQTAVVASETVAPVSAEDLEDHRDAAIEAVRLEPQGGSPADHRIWGRNAQGVKQIYAYAADGAPNEVNIFVEAYVGDSTDGMGTPTSTILEAVEDVIELSPDDTLTMAERSRLPIGQWPNVLPVTPKAITVTINGFNGLTAEKEALIASALVEMVNKVRPFVAACDAVADRKDELTVNDLTTAINNVVPGGGQYSIDMTVATVPLTTYQFNDGDIPFLDPTDITYVP